MNVTLSLTENGDLDNNSLEMLQTGNITDLLTEPINGTNSAQMSDGMTEAHFLRNRRLLWNAQLYLTPIIIIIGLLGNIMSFLVFVSTSLRHLSSSIYLAALALVDSGFLFQVQIMYLNLNYSRKNTHKIFNIFLLIMQNRPPAQGIKRYIFIVFFTKKMCCYTLSFVYHCHIWKELL